MSAVSDTTYELESSLMKIAQIMQDSKKLAPGSKIVYVGPLPAGIVEVYYEYSFEDNLNVRFVKPIDIERIGEIGRTKGYYTMLLPTPDETQEVRTKIYNQNGEFVTTEVRQQINRHNWFKLTKSENEYLGILKVSTTNPQIVSIGKEFKIRWPGKGPVSNSDALEILEQYRHEMYDDN